MSDRFDQLSVHHGNLRAHCALQRQHLAKTALEIESQLGGVDRGVSLVRNVVRSPALIMGGVALVALVGPKRLLRWASRGALFYTTARRLLRLRNQ
jgi:hypothetical protein